MRFATIGTSWITDAFIEGAKIAGGLELAAVYSRSEETGKNFSAKYGNVPVFTDLERLAKSDIIDAVYIASPNVYHYPQSRLFLENGKHVLCEKPATVTPKQMEELIELANKNNLVYMEAIMMRYLPARKTVHQALGKLGNIHTARFDFSQLSSKYPEYKAGSLPNIFNPAMATGCLMDLGIYCVYAAVDFFGHPKKITATSGFLKSGADGYGTAIFDYDDKQVTLTYSKLGQSYLGSEILGDKGTLKINSISRLSGITLIENTDSGQQTTQLVGDIPKPELMSGEAAAFRKFASNPDGFKGKIEEAARQALMVSEIMEKIRKMAGINFPAEISLIK
ncbi:MAG TPA: Gfo/Idh/MocA family oxidoreductase [Clostridiales bacterium]|nr:Gfo/Idh/MocA family oxidoreductase [Clostridiales bacterium]